MSQDISAQTEIPDEWIKQFKSKANCDPTATAAWNEISEAGLEEGALFCLWGYSGGAEDDMERMHRHAGHASSQMKAATRADKIAQAKRPSRARNPKLFQQRAFESHQNALKTEWPMTAACVHTVGDELALASEQYGRRIPLDAARKAMMKAAGKRSPVNGFFFLFLLQAYTNKHGVMLGSKRLVSIAGCTGSHLDEGTFGRYLRQIPRSRRDSILRDALPTLPPPVSRKQRQ